MATTTTKKTNGSPLELPTELWARVFGFLTKDRDMLDLWTGCRPVCLTFKKEVEFIFQEKHLPKTYITFDSDLYNPYKEFKFMRLSDDNATAVFEVDVDPELEDEGGAIEREAWLRDYVDNINDESHLMHPQHVVQVRRSINDTAISKLSVNFDTMELSCDWRGMVSALLYEESRVNDLQAQWVGGKESHARAMSAKIQSGEMTMEEALMWALGSFDEQRDEGVKEARRLRIRRQVETFHPDSEVRKDWSTENLKEGDWIADQGQLKKLKEFRQLVALEEFSDDEEEEDDDDDDEDEDGDEDDEWEDEDEDEAEYSEEDAEETSV